MKNTPILTDDEVRACMAAVDTLLYFDDENQKHTQFDYETRRALLGSSYQKLSVYSPFTYFTKQEFIMIHDALDYMIEVNSIFGDDDPEFYTAFEKTAELAGLS